MSTLRVVMPVHNAGNFLAPALDSVLADLPDGAELMIVDDGSADASPAVLAGYAERDDRVTVLRNESPTGVSNALNRAIRHGRCPEYVAVAEHDDIVLPGRFATQLRYLRDHPRCGAASSTGQYIGPTGTVFGRVAVGPRNAEEQSKHVALGAPILISHPAIMYRKAALDDVGLYESEFDGAQDLEIVCRLVYAGGWDVRRLPDVHFHYRLHESATSFAKMAEQQDITRYISYRNSAMRDSQPYAGYGEWRVSHRLSRWARFNADRLDLGALLYRRAGLAWVSSRRVRSAGLLVASAVVHPQWVLFKLRVLAGRT